jgi:hypothetical protein
VTAQPPPPDPQQPGYPPPYPGYYPYPVHGHPGYPVRPPAPDVNALAIVSLVFGIVGGVVFALGFGIGALVQIRKSGERGRGLAIAGLSLAGVWTVALVASVAVLLAVAPWEDDRGAGGLQAGVCVDDVNGARPVVSCDAPHEGEVYATFVLPSGPWPGEQAMTAEAAARCTGELHDYLAQDTAFGRLRSVYLLPQEGSWPDDRRVVCIARDPAGPMTGSLHD